MTRDARTPAPDLRAPDGSADPGGVLASIGLVAYDWRIDTDILIWGANASEVLQVGDPHAYRHRARVCGFARSDKHLNAL